MIIVTGAAGFIGSALISRLNDDGIKDIILVDDFSFENKNLNLKDKSYSKKIERDIFVDWFKKNTSKIDFVIHIGARTDTTEKDWDIFLKLNLNYSKDLWTICAKNSIPFIYASSAATYGLGEHGYKDSHSIISHLKPLNPYGDSKNEFDIWALQQKNTPPNWYGLKFFNVYGPNEYHKGRMASVIFHTFNQISNTGKMNLFKSHNPDYKNGHQKRDFIYVKDVLDIILFLYKSLPQSGLYNLGTGRADTFLNLATHTFEAQHLEPNIGFIDTPDDIRDTYQYFTEADISKLRNAGYTKKFYNLKDGVYDYVKNYLIGKKYL